MGHRERGRGPNPEALRTEPHRTEPGWPTLAIYAVPTLGVAAPGFLVQFYFLSFATDALLIAPALVGGILAAGRIWDAITDPLAGYGSDRTRTRWGRRRPWMAAAAPATAASFVLLWNPPAALQSAGLLAAWSAVGLILFTTAFTAWDIPHQALGVELSDDPHARTRIFGVRFVVALLGVALSFAAMQFVGTAADPRAAAGALAWVVGAAMLALLLVPVLGLRERPELRTHKVTSPWRAMGDVVAHRQARRLLAIWFAAQLGMASQGVIAPYMATYVMGRSDLMGVMPALFIGPLILSVPLWVRLSRRRGRKPVWFASMLAAAASYALLFLLPADDFAVTGVLLAMAGFFSGCIGPVGPSFFASVVDQDARKTGERREGVYFAAKEFVEKSSAAFVALVVGGALQFAGFEPNVEQSETVRWVIRACLGLFPGGALLVGAALLRGLEIGDESLQV